MAHFYSNVGSPIEDTYEYVIEKGKKVLKKIGTTNIYEKIQNQPNAGSSVKEIIARAVQGDPFALCRDVKYGDYSVAPKNLAEFHELSLKAELDFYKLPTNVREEFDNSYGVFVDKMQSGEGQSILNKYLKVENKAQIEASEASATQIANEVTSGNQNTPTGVNLDVQ